MTESILQLVEPVCGQCQKVFAKKKRTQLYCSKLCKDKVHRKRSLEYGRNYMSQYRLKHKERISKYMREYARQYSFTPKGKYFGYKNNAKTRGVIFALTFDEFKKFWQKPCHYCGDIVPTIGLDKIEASKGYILGNIVSCCEHCNYMKLDYPELLFIEQCMKILRHRGLL